MADPTYQPKVYRDLGGDRLTVAAGGTLAMEGRITGLTFTTDYFIDVTLGSDSGNDGFAPGDALASITQAFTNATALIAADSDLSRGRFRFFVAPGGYEEDVVTPLNTELPFGQLIAYNPTTQSFGGAYIFAATASTFSVIVRARGWQINGFEIGSVANGGSLHLDGLTANSNPGGMDLRNCLMAGWAATASIGIDVTGNGAPHTTLFNNHFDGYLDSAIICSESGTDQPRFWEVDKCTFVDNANHIRLNPRGFKECVVKNCNFIQVGANRTATKQFDNTGGSNTIVGPNNILSGTYDDASGGYQGSGSDDWAGNYNVAGVTAANPT